VWFGPWTEGPPGHVHGGCITTVLDSAMGGCAWVNGHKVLAANLNVDFRASVPLGTIALAEGIIEEVSGRKVIVKGALRGENGTLFAEARGLFIVIPEERLAALNRRREALDAG
jgi:acyl-coenzyme A thioesterase PaaI-like protein